MGPGDAARAAPEEASDAPGWGTRIRTLISGTRIRCPAVRRSPKGLKTMTKATRRPPGRPAEAPGGGEHYSGAVPCQARAWRRRTARTEASLAGPARAPLRGRSLSLPRTSPLTAPNKGLAFAPLALAPCECQRARARLVEADAPRLTGGLPMKIRPL